MKFISMIVVMLSFMSMTACGGSSGGDDKSADAGSSVGQSLIDDPSIEEPEDIVKSDLDSLPLILVGSVNENTIIALEIPEYKDSNSYVLEGVDADSFSLSLDGNVIVFNEAPDYEVKKAYDFVIHVTNVMNQTKSIGVIINVVDVPEDLNSLPLTITESVNENSRFAFKIPEYKDTNSYEFVGVDGSKFKLWAERGEVVFNDAPDFETQDVYQFTMIVTNAIEQTKDLDVLINIVDVSNDFIFEVAEGINGSLHLRLNHDEQDVYEGYSFTIKKDNDQEQLFEFTGEINNKFVVIKPRNYETEPVQRYTITPNTDDGLPGFMFWPNVGTVKIKVVQWGDNSWKSLNYMFRGVCQADESLALLSFSDPQSLPNLERATDMTYAFAYCDLIESQAYWDVSNINKTTAAFALAKGSVDLSQWDVSSVNNMEYMFYYAELFNHDISDWSVENVTNCEDFKKNAPLFMDEHTPNFQSCNQSPAP